MFDAARRADADGIFTEEDVAKIHAALDAAGVPDSRVVPDAPSGPENADIPAQVSEAGLALIKRFEGCARKRPDGKMEAYPDPGTGGEPWTIGWGTTRMNGRAVRPGDVISQAKADMLLTEDLVRFEQEVIVELGDALVRTSQAQSDALVSFHYNTGAIGRATLTRRHIGGHFSAAAREFDRWTYAGGRVMKGLVRRRAAERALYESGS